MEAGRPGPAGIDSDIFSVGCRLATAPFDQLVTATNIEERRHENHR
jgi:hypothetical protein